MRSKRWWFVLLTASSLGPGAQALAADPEPTLAPEEKIFGLSMIWQEANYNFAFFDLSPELDWDAEYKNAVTRALATETTYEYLREAQRFVALLGEAHTSLKLGEIYRSRFGGIPPIELEEIERRAVVINVAESLSAELPLGSEIVSLDGRATAEVLKTDVFPFLSASTEQYLWRRSIRGHRWRAVGLLTGEAGTRVTLTVETPGGEVKDVVVERVSPTAEIDWARRPRNELPLLEFRWLPGDIVYFALNSFNDPAIVELFEVHLEELSRARAVILDVRNNGGGNSRNGWNIGRHFSDVPLAASRWKTRTHLAAYKAWGARSQDPEKKAHAEMNAWDGPTELSWIDRPEDGGIEVPLAILLGPSTYSAAEDFLSFMRAVPHGVYVGGRSAGSTGQPLNFPIPGGASVGITSKRDTMADGTEFVGYGVVPDVDVHQTVRSFREGWDPVMERAVAVLEERMP